MGSGDVLHVRLLGRAEFVLGGRRLPGFPPRLQSLLGYLLVHRGTAIPRARIAGALWPDSAAGQARTNLRQLLHQLRQLFDEVERFVEIGAATLRWYDDAPVVLDVAELERAGEARDLATLSALAERCAGDLLPECDDEWVSSERERLRRIRTDVLKRLIEAAAGDGQLSLAIARAEELLALDPLEEAAHARLIRLHAQAGNRTRALRAYHACATSLQVELGVLPSAATQSLYRSLLAGASAEPSDRHAPAPARAPLVGRDAALGRAMSAWHAAAAGNPGVLVVGGEAGIGKTRLLEELGRTCVRGGAARAATRSYSAEGRLALAPVLDWLRSPALAAGVATLDEPWRRELARLLPELGPVAGAGQGLADRTRFLQSLLRAIRSVPEPLLLVLDDVQWCDPDTWEFLHFLARSARDARLLVALTLRTEDAGDECRAALDALRALGTTVDIDLEPLDRGACRELAERAAGSELSDEQVDRLYRTSAGNPLFLVESVRAGSAEAAHVQAVVNGRLGQLSPAAAELVAVAAVVGREFDAELLGAAGLVGPDDLVAGLDELWRRRIVREHGFGQYDFAHDRIRETALARVAPARRRALHLAVAQALSALHAAELGPVCAELARHWEGAGLPSEAIACHRLAAQLAQRVYGDRLAIEHLEHALALLAELPETASRERTELDLRVTLGPSLVVLDGYGAAATFANYDRAEELCARGAGTLTPPVLRGLALASIVTVDLERANELGRRLLQDPNAASGTKLIVEGHYVLGVTAFWHGRLEDSRDHLNAALAAYREQDRQTHLSMFGQDPKIVCLCRLALSQWYLGQCAQARRAVDESVALAEELAHPFSLGYALVFATWLAYERGDLDEATRLAEAVLAVTERHGVSTWGAIAQCLLGWVQTCRGDVEGIARIRFGIAESIRFGHLVQRPLSQTLLVDALRAVGRHAEAWEALRDLESHVARHPSGYVRPQLLRLRAELLLEDSPPADPRRVADALAEAIAAARAQRNAVGELRAAITLARWRLRVGTEGERSAARTTLNLARTRFAPDAHTADLAAAAELTQRL